MQPTCRQVPPRKGSFSTTTVFSPSSPARMAATYPPGPLPIIATSYFATLNLLRPEPVRRLAAAHFALSLVFGLGLLCGCPLHSGGCRAALSLPIEIAAVRQTSNFISRGLEEQIAVGSKMDLKKGKR